MNPLNASILRLACKCIIVVNLAAVLLIPVLLVASHASGKPVPESDGIKMLVAAVASLVASVPLCFIGFCVADIHSQVRRNR